LLRSRLVLPLISRIATSDSRHIQQTARTRERGRISPSAWDPAPTVAAAKPHRTRRFPRAHPQPLVTLRDEAVSLRASAHGRLRADSDSWSPTRPIATTSALIRAGTHIGRSATASPISTGPHSVKAASTGPNRTCRSRRPKRGPARRVGVRDGGLEQCDAPRPLPDVRSRRGPQTRRGNASQTSNAMVCLSAGNARPAASTPVRGTRRGPRWSGLRHPDRCR